MPPLAILVAPPGLYVQMYVCRFLVNIKGNPSLSNENAMTDFCQTWYVGSGGGTNTTRVVCRHRMRIFNTSFAYLF